MDKIAGLKEILALDPENSFARYGIAMELASRGETAAALAEFDTLLANDPDYTAGYFMAAQTLAGAGRKPEAIERLKAGISCADAMGNSHAVNEMQAMLDELDRVANNHLGRPQPVVRLSATDFGFRLQSWHPSDFHETASDILRTSNWRLKEQTWRNTRLLCHFTMKKKT